ncbi:hypothetical protein [Spelaeicoccus albus]|uniref:hypothetical protein n=1 Tax=Spelaeicoccus albus TaxID=1280376 RepID=UPI0027E1E079|nr:hypothetical protein [Spelaeicoccus albus]
MSVTGETAAEQLMFPPDGLSRFLMTYRFGIDEMMTKINILKDEFTYTHEYSPIEHVTSRLKEPKSIVEKACQFQKSTARNVRSGLHSLD